MVTLTTPTCLVLFHLLLSSTSANPLKHTSHLAKRALELEDKSQGFKYYNWSTLRPSTAEDVEIHGIKMPKRVQVTSYDGTVDDDVWQPGTVFSYAQWSAITGYNETYHSLQKRQDLGDTWGPDCGRNQCLDGCTEDKVMAWQEGYYDTFGNFHKEAGEVCGDGSAGRTYASSTTWGISLQAGPDLKGKLFSAVTDSIDKLGLRVGGSFSKSIVHSTSYTMSFPALTRGTVWYRPYIGVAHLPAKVCKVWSDRSGVHICSTSQISRYDVHLPRIHAGGEGDGLWGSCFYRDRMPCHFTLPGRIPPGGMVCPAGW